MSKRKLWKNVCRISK